MRGRCRRVPRGCRRQSAAGGIFEDRPAHFRRKLSAQRRRAAGRADAAAPDAAPGTRRAGQARNVVSRGAGAPAAMPRSEARVISGRTPIVVDRQRSKMSNRQPCCAMPRREHAAAYGSEWPSKRHVPCLRRRRCAVMNTRRYSGRRHPRYGISSVRAGAMAIGHRSRATPRSTMRRENANC